MENKLSENHEGSAHANQPDRLETQTNDTLLSLPSQEAAAPDPEAWVRRHRLAPIQSSFPFFGCLSLAFGIMFTFCLYNNPCGITYPLFTLFACLCGILACRKLEMSIKKESWFLMGTAVLIGISTCRTADIFLIYLNGLALVFLGCIFAIHQFYEDRTWNIGKYFSSIILYLCHSIGAVLLPFRHLRTYAESQNNKALRHFPAILLGAAAAMPVLILLAVLLSEADPVFSKVMAYALENLLHPVLLAKLFLWTLFGTLALYCLVCSCCLHKISEKNPDRVCIGPVTAVAGFSGIALLYLVFSVIQIVYLFLGKGTLPYGYTYSGYARQGFFQLLAVSAMNLMMVLCSLKYIRPHKVLNWILTLICGCTYIMIASAGWRLMLYVQEYHLSYLRLLALWFLCLLAVLMAGVTWIIWNRRFPLFSFFLTVVSLFYAALAWARPDYVIAWDYVSHLENSTAASSDLFYLTRQLGADAAPAVASICLDPSGLLEKGQDEGFDEITAVWLDTYYDFHAWTAYENLGIRNYNFSFAQAKRLFPES